MIEIIELNKTHIDELHLIEEASFSEPWSKMTFLKELENPDAYYIVAMEEQKIVGYAGMWVILDEGHIGNIAVADSKRGTGIGKKLVRNLMDKGINLKLTGLTLEVRESNTIAQNLYESLGFYSVGKRKNYYNQPTEDGVIMWNYFSYEED